VLAVVEEAVDGDVTAGIVGTVPTLPTVGDTPIVGTAAAELTPRLPISVEPIGIPVRAPPPGVVGEVDVGADDAAMLLEPEPHIPDIPDVSSVPDDPEDTGISDVTDVVDDVDVPDVAVEPDVAVVPELAAVAGAAVPADMPPPSKLAVDPNISEGEVAAVEHVVPLVVVGMVIVPVMPVGTGLTPGEVISVASNGIPVRETAEPVATPSGEVAPIVGVGVGIAPTCAMAALPTNSAGRTTAISKSLVDVFRLQTASPRRAPISTSFATGSLGVMLSDIDQSLTGGARSFGKISSGRCSISCSAPRPTSVASRRTSKASLAPLRSLENADRNLLPGVERERALRRLAAERERAALQRLAAERLRSELRRVLRPAQSGCSR